MSNILILEDTEELTNLYKDLLEGSGHEIVVIEEAEEALGLYQKGANDLCIIDQRLKGKKKGLDYVAHLRRQNDYVPVIMITAHPKDSGIVSIARDLGVRFFIGKNAGSLLTGLLFKRVVQIVLGQIKTKENPLGKEWDFAFLESFIDNTLKRTLKCAFPVPQEMGYSFVEFAAFEEPTQKYLCSSSQTGCRMGCKFCKTGNLASFVRNLTYEEIVYFIFFVALLHGFPEKFDVLFEGEGEPTLNPNVLKFIREYSHILPCRISTIGVGTLESFLDELSDYPVEQVQFSLNADEDDLRGHLMPATKGYPIERSIRRIRKHTEKTGKTASLNYISLADINDSPNQIRNAVRKWGKDWNCFFRFSQANEFGIYRTASRKKLKEAKEIAGEEGVAAKIFTSAGREIKAGCGEFSADEWLRK
jgi:23S rRNA (adenine2503-C2)-methyltransferase